MIVSKANLTAFTILGVFATALAPAVGGDQRNFLVIGISFLSLLAVFFFRWPLRDTLWLAVLLPYMIVVTMLTGPLGNLTSVFYTGLFACSYLCFAACLKTGRVDKESLIAFLRALILAFGIVSVAQMATSLVGLPVPNQILSKGLWSYNSLAVEPSHLGRVLPISMLVYLALVRSSMGRRLPPLRLLWQERLVVAAFLVSISLSGSTLAILAAPLALLFAFPARWILVLSGATIVAWPFVLLLDLPAVQRGLVFMAALPSMDIQQLHEADHSASIRVAPIIIYFNKIDFTSSEFWFGGGVSAAVPFLSGEIRGVADGAVGGGFFPLFLLSFGLVGTMLMLSAFLLRFLHPVTLTMVALWLLLFLPSAWNTQLFWFGLMMLRALHHFEVGALRWRSYANWVDPQTTYGRVPA